MRSALEVIVVTLRVLAIQGFGGEIMSTAFLPGDFRPGQRRHSLMRPRHSSVVV